ncbi:MAG: cupin domain-containing protein [Corynebacterium sp.]|nr:cupin domain-containing protein [Corynebacterium sp.]
MKLIPKAPTAKNPPEYFTGDVWLDMLATPQGTDQRMTVALVRFAPGARTAWHAYARGQTLHIAQGTALIGMRDGQVIRASAGQTVYLEPGEEHWHGATATDFMEHLALQENTDDSANTTTWLEHVSDDDYQNAQEK